MRSAVSAFIVWVRAATEVPGRIMGAVGLGSRDRGGRDLGGDAAGCV